MDRLLMSSVAIATVSIPLLSNLPEFFPEYSITILNGSENEVLEAVYATPIEQDNFSRNLLSRGIEPLGDVTLRFSIEGEVTIDISDLADECALDVWLYDFLFVFSNGNEVRDYGVNVCETTNTSYIVDDPFEEDQQAANIFTIYNGTEDTIKSLTIQVSDGTGQSFTEQSLLDNEFSLEPYDEIQVFSMATRELVEQLDDVCQQESYRYSLTVTSRGPEPLPLRIRGDLLTA